MQLTLLTAWRPRWRHVLPFVLSLLTTAASWAQVQTFPLRAYSFAASQGTYTPVPFVYETVQVKDITQDDNESRPFDIGFPFVFEGATYTRFVMDSNGWLSLTVGSATSSNNGFDLQGTRAYAPLFAPLWDDLHGRVGQAFFLTEGTAPNRVLTAEWRNWSWPRSAGDAQYPYSTISFQVKLYETTGVIQYCYRQEAGIPQTSELSATIGIRGNYLSFLSLSDASAAPTVSSTVSTNTINQRPATGQVYTFTPPTACPNPTSVTATATSQTTATVSFVPGANSPVSYKVQYFATSGNQSGTVTGTTSPVELTGLLPATTYQIMVFSTCSNGASSPGTQPAVYVTTLAPPNTNSSWTGAVSRAWDEPGNWSANLVPAATTNVLINATANQPIVTGRQVSGVVRLRPDATLTLTANSQLSASGYVSLPPGSSLVQAAGSTLAIGGYWNNNGATLTLDPTSTVSFWGSTPHDVGGGEPTTFQNLVVGDATPQDELNLTNAISVQHLLKTVQNSIVQVQTDGSLRLLDGAQVVRDADSFVAGSVTAEKLLPAAGRHFYAAPVRTATLAGLAAPGYAPVVNAAYNTSANPAAVVPYPTVFGFDQSRISTAVEPRADFETGFFSPTALTEVITPGLGYRLDTSTGALLAVTGPLNSSNITRSGLTRGTLPQSGYHLLGNPYPGVLDWDAVAGASTTTGLDAAIYTSQPNGTYRPYVNGIGAGRYVLPGQAFWVRVSAASTPASVTFTQAARYPDFFNAAAPPTTTEIRPLLQLSLAGATGPADEATVYFQPGATAGFDARFDATRLPTSGLPYLAWADAQPLAISGRPLLTDDDLTLPLTVGSPAAGTYSLTASRLLNLPPGTFAYLRDAQTGTNVNLAQQPTYSFTLGTTPTSTRFSVLLTRDTKLAVAPAALSKQVAVYPVPARNLAWLELPAALQSKPLQVALYNTLGQTVRTWNLPAAAQPHSLNLLGLAPGAYHLRLATSQGTVSKAVLVE
ncbi:fibronectin type III domain-containing protein [Hymenobacter chitinivorans]|uniref:Putative secreted protein (Por secretion system target) n=1 Tax=Hymenobacter chitinivorans DSM 11115 TaxID=1121954 RepID=A0A2M9APX9_9BACT|nr:fibronectin type III domain-containing protein [Hymenobacter chitinivorans]PJJ47756.1 putative secreted protein (Por secretion system target) [Hymenobacter chitinivorans DSM 11115]